MHARQPISSTVQTRRWPGTPSGTSIGNMGQACSQLRKRRKSKNTNRQPVARNTLASISSAKLPKREDKRNDHPFFNSGQEFFARYAIPFLVTLHGSNDSRLTCETGAPEYVRLTVEIWDSSDEQQRRFWNGAAAEIKVLISRGVISSKSAVQHGGLFTRVWEYEQRAKQAVDDFLEAKRPSTEHSSGSTTPRAATAVHETSSFYSQHDDEEDRSDAAIAQMFVAQSSSLPQLHSDLPDPKEYQLIVRNLSPLTLTSSLDSHAESEAPTVLQQTASMQHLRSVRNPCS